MTTGTTSRATRFTEVAATARAFWSSGRGTGEVRPVTLREPGPDDVLVRTSFSAVSRGTESLVWDGRVPAVSHDVMRAPFQEGDFPGPVKYGYLSVGVVERGPDALAGRTVFCLHPHQTSYVVPAAAVAVVPDGVPPERAVLTGLVETAVNALWDVPPLVGDRVAVVGAGALGCCVARLAAGVPGTSVTLVDVDAERAAVAERLGVGFALPAAAPTGLDLVVHTSATAEGLRRSLQLLRREGTVVELSWYGDRETPVALGDVFHSGRLTVRGSQVGSVSPARRDSRTHADRLALAARLLRDDAFDALLTSTSTFDELPVVLARLASGELGTLTHLVTYADPSGANEGDPCTP
jgi:NADPH:quinone reductase-like Zn-dependent oxidoreductase